VCAWARLSPRPKAVAVVVSFNWLDGIHVNPHGKHVVESTVRNRQPYGRRVKSGPGIGPRGYLCAFRDDEQKNESAWRVAAYSYPAPKLGSEAQARQNKKTVTSLFGVDPLEP
jgi:hypothetical protein